MKSISLFVMALFLCVNSNLWTQESKETKSDPMIKMVTIEVPTIKCGSCVKSVGEALKKLDGVKEVKVDKKSKTAMVHYDESKLKVTDMELAIAKAGYDANETKRDPKAYEDLDDCCK